MTDAQTTSSALSAAIQAKVQSTVLPNLRAALVYADPQYAMEGDFDEGTDSLMWVDVPDLAINTTALTEGTRPDKRALSLNTVTCSTTQYGDLVAITDVAKVKSPVQIASIAAGHVQRQAAESIDQVNRDAIAAGGTVFYQGTNTTRAGIGAGENATVDDLDKLASTMFAGKLPRFADGFYRLFVSPNVAYDLRVSDDFKEAYKYVDNMPLIKGEIGQISGFRVIEVVNAPTVASSVTVHLSIAVGAIKGWGSGDLQTLEVRHIAPGGDHTDPLGQEELIGWKVMFGVAVLKNSFYFRYESAATAL